MSTNETGGNESDGEPFECPECGRVFDSETGMKIHYGKSHDGSIAGVAVDCRNCGSTIRRNKNWAESTDNHFCSMDCLSDHGRVDVTCPGCGDVASKKKSTVENSENNFCSHSCRSVYNARIYNTEDPESKELVECDQCGDEYEKYSYRVGRYSRQFCSKQCKYDFYSESGWYSGENAPNWAGGITRFRYGRNWQTQRKRRLESDNYECVVCSMTNETHKSRYSKSLHVHHIIPRSKFMTDDEFDYERANRLDNLVTLCHPHHKEWEGIPLRPQ